MLELRDILKELRHLLEAGEPGLALELVETMELNATEAKVTGLGEKVWGNIRGYIEMKLMSERTREQSGVDVDVMLDYSRMFNVLTPPSPPKLWEILLPAEGAERSRGVGYHLQRVRELRAASCAARDIASPAVPSPGGGASESSSPGCSRSSSKRASHKIKKSRTVPPSEEVLREGPPEGKPPRCEAMVSIPDRPTTVTADTSTTIALPILAATSQSLQSGESSSGTSVSRSASESSPALCTCWTTLRTTSESTFPKPALKEHHALMTNASGSAVVHVTGLASPDSG
eukprot:TRINITY_DN13659_c0_g1_i2.p1 TRINITY_DN13659_c0_g1~~TRINITY_DN13659_c0_g1_i2.p1  ORF type:complete len:288 (-),score=38.91 TRINITY_DN13659_c0_g1_i2:547-1410(-)